MQHERVGEPRARRDRRDAPASLPKRLNRLRYNARAPSKEFAMLSESERKEIFLAVVQLQDRGDSVSESRQVIAERFGLTPRQVQRIEQEGLGKDWPPLSDGADE